MTPKSMLVLIAGLAAGALPVLLLPESTLFLPAGGSAAATTSGGIRYACPMMDFIGNKPGNCPVCGMQMTPVTAGDLSREQLRRMDVDTTMVREGPATMTIRASGTVRRDDRAAAAVVARIAGRVVRRHPGALHVGTLVHAGDPLMDLYSAEAYAAQAELSAAVKLADTRVRDALLGRFERWNLRPVADAILAGAEPSDTVTITSPFAGLVDAPTAVPMNSTTVALPSLGEEVMADTPLLRLVPPDAFMVALQIPEHQSRWLLAGQPVSLAADDIGPLPELRASISWIAPAYNTNLRTREVHLHVADVQQRLLAGSLVSARIQVALGPSLAAADPARPETHGHFPLVPKSAVLSTGTRHVVWKVAGRDKDGRTRFAIAPVALGPRIEADDGNDFHVVRAGLRAGDEVATRGAFLIDSQAQLAGSASLLFPTGSTNTPAAHRH